MLKKIRQKIYNRKTRKELQGKQFDNFAYCGDNEYPYFVIRATKERGHIFFTPKTSEMFYMSIGKLKDSYFMAETLDQFQEKVDVYCENFNFSKNVKTNAMLMFIAREKEATEEIRV